MTFPFHLKLTSTTTTKQDWEWMDS